MARSLALAGKEYAGSTPSQIPSPHVYHPGKGLSPPLEPPWAPPTTASTHLAPRHPLRHVGKRRGKWSALFHFSCKYRTGRQTQVSGLYPADIPRFTGALYDHPGELRSTSLFSARSIMAITTHSSLASTRPGFPFSLQCSVKELSIHFSVNTDNETSPARLLIFTTPTWQSPFSLDSSYDATQPPTVSPTRREYAHADHLARWPDRGKPQALALAATSAR